jgi:ribosome biogenesis GTPase / thiamine phosphate phosphatase
MRIEVLGYNETLEKFRKENIPDNFVIGRVTAEHKERYIVVTNQGEAEAEITGNMRFKAEGRADFPAVGDWVTLTVYDSEFAVIHEILPRYSILKRQAVGKPAEVQLIAANIDYAFIVQSADRDFNINRLERYLAICNSGKVKPIIVLSKTDLAGELRINEIMETLKARVRDVPFIAINNQNPEGYRPVKDFMVKGKTYCMLGSSGVGKSTLLNNLAGKTLMQTATISQSTNKGKHVTSHRELIVLDDGSIIIDNPGMREVGIADAEGGLEVTFNAIAVLSQNCRFKDCTHTSETGCSVLEALEKGEIDPSSYENYLKLEREKAFFESTVEERRKKEKKFGKMMKNYKKDMKKKK